MIKKINLGKRLPVGDWFVSTTKKQSKEVTYGTRFTPFKVYKSGYKGVFEKGKRKYFCVVIGLMETRTGYYPASMSFPKENLSNKLEGKRWWMFSYIVEIIEN